MIERSMQTPYSLEELPTDNGSKKVIVVKTNSEEKKLTIVVTIYGYHIKTEKGFRAFTEFFEGNNRIDDLEIIIKNKRFWGLIEYYYHNAIIGSLSEEEGEGEGEEQLLLNDRKFGRHLRPTVKGSHFISEVARTITSRPSPKANRMMDPNFLITFGSLRQGFSVYTTFKNHNHEEITIARTHVGIGAYANKYANLTLFNRKLSTVFFHHLHLANVILANRLILKQTSDIIAGIEKVVSYIRRRALPFSLVIAAVHATAAAYYTGNISELSLSQIFSEPEQLGNNLFYLVVLPLLWPITAFFVRLFAPKIIPTIVRYAIKRVLKS
jgi:hypothetical protein